MASKTDPAAPADPTIDPKTDLAAPADIPDKATPLTPGDPVRVPSAGGSTFAERRAARLAGENKAVQASEAK